MPTLRVRSFELSEAEAGVRLILESGSSGCDVLAVVAVWACNLDKVDSKEQGEAVRVSIRPKGSRLARSWTIVDEKGKSPYEGASEDVELSPKRRLSKVDIKHDASAGTIRISGRTTSVIIQTQGDFSVQVFHAGITEAVQSDTANDAYVLDGETNTLRHTLKFDPAAESLFGFGESSGPLLKNGRRLRVDARDSMGYSALTSDPLYKHWPYGLSVRKTDGACVGLLYDTMRRGTFDLGCEISAFRGRYRYFEASEAIEGYSYYVIPGSNPEEVQTRLAGLIGRPALPPRWSVGYLGSSMAYTEDERAVDRLAKYLDSLREKRIPCDGFHLSSGYTTDREGRRCVFTWNRSRVPDPAKLFERFNQQGVNVIANVKPWLLTQHPDFDLVKTSGGLFDSVSEPGTPAKGRFWVGGAGTSGYGCYLDFTSKAAREWWIRGARTSLLERGCKALWNDNNEYELEEGRDALCRLDGVTQLTSRPTVAEVGRALQTQLMARASLEALEGSAPWDAGPVLVVSRAGSIGTHRYAAQTWSGDNSTNWDTLKYNMSMMLSLGLCGWPGSGPDVGGFAGQRPSEELFVRWCQCAAFLPRFSIHSSVWKTATSSTSVGTTPTSDSTVDLTTTNEPWMFPALTDHIRAIIQARYRMRTWIFSLYVESSLVDGFPVARPLLFHFPHDVAVISGEAGQFDFMLGPGLLVSPVLHPSESEHNMYLPKKDGKFWYDLRATTVVDCGWITLPVSRFDDPLIVEDGYAGVPVFLREGSGFPMCCPEFEGSLCNDSLLEVVLGADMTTGDASCTWYEGEWGEYVLSAMYVSGDCTLTVKPRETTVDLGSASREKKRAKLDMGEARERFSKRNFHFRIYQSGKSGDVRATVTVRKVPITVMF